MPAVARQLPLVQRTVPLLSVLPKRVRAMLSGRAVGSERQPVVVLPHAVRSVLRHPEKISVSDHAKKYRIVTDGAHEGPWRHEHAPHTVKIMDTFGLPWVREVWFCGVEQSGKTNTMLNCMQWAIDCAPGNTFYLMPSEESVKKIVGKKLGPMLSKSPKLSRLISARKDDTGLSLITLNNGVSIFPAHANSATSMATWAAKYSFADEVDKYPPMTGKEADPITLVKKRNRTYRGRYKRFFASTPNGKFVYSRVYGDPERGIAGCHQVWQFRLRCPSCEELVRPEGEHLDLDETATPESIERDGVACACPSCGVLWGERERMAAIRAGSWVAVKGADLVRPAKVGFHHRAWDCLDITLVEIGVAYLNAKKGDLAAKVAWANGYEAIDYEHTQQDRKEDHILRLVDPSLPRGVVPNNPLALLLLVDTQKFGFRYQVWAVGYGQHPVVTVIDRGFVHKFSDLENLAAKEWQDAGGLVYRISAGWIDSGGGTDPHRPKHSRTQAVYLFCKKNPLFRPVKGRRQQAQSWNFTRLEYLPSRSGKKIPLSGGLNLYTLNVTLYKGEVATALEVEMGDPGSLRLHAGIGSDYAQQMCAEYQDEGGWWICPSNKANHDWDISVYGFAAIDIMGLRNISSDTAGSVRRRGVRSRGVHGGAQ